MSTLGRGIAVVVGLLGAGPVFAEPGRYDLMQATDPILVRAREADLAIAHPRMGDQARAEELYLAFIEQNPDSELVPHVYTRLAFTFGGWVTPPRRKAGAVRDNDKVRKYFQKCIETYPEGKLGMDLIGAMVSVVSLAPTPEEKVDEYIEFYQFLLQLEQLTDKELAERLWLGSRLEQYAATREGYAEGRAAQFREMLKGHRGLASRNMVGIPLGSGRANKVELLSKIIHALPDHKPARLARAAFALESKRELEQLFEQALEQIDVHPQSPPVADDAGVDGATAGAPLPRTRAASGGSGSAEQGRAGRPSALWTAAAAACGTALLGAAVWLVLRRRARAGVP